jgi:hypothetical protein
MVQAATSTCVMPNLPHGSTAKIDIGNMAKSVKRHPSIDFLNRASTD